MWNADQFVAVFACAGDSLWRRSAVVEREVRDVMICFELFEQVISANLPALVNGMEQFGFQPYDLHENIGPIGPTGPIFDPRYTPTRLFSIIGSAAGIASLSKNLRCYISKITSTHTSSESSSPAWCSATISRTNSGAKIPRDSARSLTTYSSPIDLNGPRNQLPIGTGKPIFRRDKIFSGNTPFMLSRSTYFVVPPRSFIESGMRAVNSTSL